MKQPNYRSLASFPGSPVVQHSTAVNHIALVCGETIHTANHWWVMVARHKYLRQKKPVSCSALAKIAMSLIQWQDIRRRSRGWSREMKEEIAKAARVGVS